MSTSTPIGLVVVALVFTAAFIAIAQITQAGSFISYRLLSPLLRSTDHRNAYVNAAWGFNLDYHPNIQIAYSWPSMYWFLPNLDFRGVGDTKNHGYYNSLINTPYDTHLFPKHDSRYFWLGEWFSYPWQHIADVSDRLDIGNTFEQVYSNIGSKLRMWRYHWCTSSCGWHLFDSQRDERLSPLVLGLAKILVDPNAAEWYTPKNDVLSWRLYQPGRFGVYPERYYMTTLPSNVWSQAYDSVEPRKL